MRYDRRGIGRTVLHPQTAALTFKIASTLARIGLLAAMLASGSARAGLPLDLGLYRPQQGLVYLDFDRDAIPDRTIGYAPPPEHVLVADMNGDGIADIVSYVSGLWQIDLDGDGVPDLEYTFGGMPGDVPLLGDVDGDGRVDLVVYRNGTWYTSTRRDGVADRVDTFGGQPGDIPLLGDINCRGIATRIIYRSGLWYGDLPGASTFPFAALGGDPRDQPFTADWDSDCNADVGVFRDGLWLVVTDPTESPAFLATFYGAAGDRPLAARLDRSLTAPKYRRRSSSFAIYRPADRAFYFQTLPGTRPDLAPYPNVDASHVMAADLDGDGKSSLILYNGGVWLVDRGIDGTIDDMYSFGGMPDDVPLIGDVDGDGRADLVVYRAGAWYVSTARDPVVALEHHFGGDPSDIPVLGDVDGDGRADFGVYRNGIWYFDTKRDGTAGAGYVLGGAPGDVPLVADWNGDGRADLIVYRDGQWFVSTDPASGTPSLHASFGAATDLPVSGRFAVETAATPVLFATQARPIYPLGDGLVTPTIGDFDRDGRFEPLGAHNAGGLIQAVDLAAAGLANLFSPGRVNRDCRTADLNGDGIADLVCNTYSDIHNTASFARLFVGDGTGRFAEDPTFAAMGLRGYGETILAADFNNDGAVDLFIPFYSQNDPTEHSYLLINNGLGRFTDVADRAGVALRSVPSEHRVEGAQAVDYDGDGWIDFYVAGRLFRNNHNLTFSDVTTAVGLPGSFDEGVKFIDWNNDGYLDLIIHHPIFGPALWEYDGTRFTRKDVMPQYLNSDVYGVNVGDFNGDGREDVVVAGGSAAAPFILLNTGERFERDPISLLDDLSYGPVAAFDYDGDGAMDLVLSRGIRNTVVARNISPDINRQALTIEVVDAAGRRNQFGRVVRVRPDRVPGVTLSRVVDGGSAMLAQTPYPLTIPTPYPGPHRVDVRFAGANVSFTMQPGDRVRVYANGRIEPY